MTKDEFSSHQKLSETLRLWLHENPGIFLWSEIKHGIQLTEIATKKEKIILYPEIKEWRRKVNPENLSDYMNLVLENQTELVLCDVGFAFSPSYASTGNLAQLPAVVCFQDFYRLKGHLEHLYSVPVQKSEAIRTMMNCLAILEGAKLIGLDVSEEERNLEPILDFLETH